ncbi:hypothetical protein [Sandarakinorhabdus sp.]|uniref:hypothetical protein n=1 Tax=Sandarakinorhabdus sp. TaxID=1916663 RepID=UPI00286E9B7F|nr:hypothetical protein [Sandarakinorhabdus sp.]
MRGFLAMMGGAMLLGGCVSVAKTIVTAPFKAGAVIVDSATTTRSEADEDRGRAIRKQEERDRKAARKAARELERDAERPR